MQRPFKLTFGIPVRLDIKNTAVRILDINLCVVYFIYYLLKILKTHSTHHYVSLQRKSQYMYVVINYTCYCVDLQRPFEKYLYKLPTVITSLDSTYKISLPPAMFFVKILTNRFFLFFIFFWTYFLKI